MIIPMNESLTSPLDQATISNAIEIGFKIKKHLDNSATSNTICLDVTKDGASYSVSITPVFGTAGTNGSDIFFHKYKNKVFLLFL